MPARDYQQECIDLVDNLPPGRYLVQMATGLGKTYTFTHLKRTGRTLILSHREELVRQPLHWYDCETGVEMAASHASPTAEVVSASVMTMARRLERFRLCGGDMSFTSAITYDFELWSAAQGRWLEISSVSNFETFQSNRLHLRYRDESGKMQLAHTLNGSSLALPRVVAALLEDNQTEDGIVIPEVLRPYTGFDRID